MIRQSASKEPTPSSAYTTLNGVIWVYPHVALVLLVPQVFAFADPLMVTASVLIAALVLHPLRRRASRAAMRRFNHPSQPRRAAIIRRRAHGPSRDSSATCASRWRCRS